MAGPFLRPGYEARCNLKDPHNINSNIIHRLEEALDIQSELIFVNGIVFGTPTTLSSPATPLSPLTATYEAIFPLT